MMSKLCLAIAERALAGKPLIHHSCAFLMDATVPNGDVVQQLHFTNRKISSTKVDNRMLAYVRGEMSYGEANGVYGQIKPYVAAEMKVMLGVWNHMLKYGLHINRRSDIRLDDDFDRDPKPETLNCRAALAAAMRTAGLKLSRGYTLEDYGIACKRMPLGPVFDLSSLGGQSLDAVNREWKELSGNLPAPNKTASSFYDLGPEWHVGR